MLTVALSYTALLALLTAGPPGLPAQLTRVVDSLDDPTIVAIFDAANTNDIESSGLAESKATHTDVRALAKDFVTAHTGVRQQGRDLAKKLGVTPTPPKNDQSARDQAKAMAQLRAAKGEAFDRAYLAHEVAFHKAVIDAINQTLLPAIKNAELKALVLKVAPAFQAHLAAAQRLAEKYGATS